MRIPRSLVVGGLVLGAVAMARRPAASKAPQPEWARGAIIYELNVRQFTPEGTFRAILPHVEEIKRLGVGIVWFMPIHPIGMKNRKGSLGSYYAVRDYYGINPEFGTLDDFKTLLYAFHRAGIKVIIDLVANHTAWDAPMASEHPEWFKRTRKGAFVPPVPDWEDVIALDYRSKKLRAYMIEMMEYWVRDVGIDGFRCDVANMVPTSFWEEARPRLERIKSVFMLAEAEKPELLRRAFDADYASEYFKLFEAVAQNREKIDAIDGLLAHDAKQYPRGSWRMMFITNHDQNTWLESDVAMYGVPGARAFAVLSFTLPGLPLIYSGQEVGNPKRLAFFERDPIDWHPPGGAAMRAFYQTLASVYRTHPALRNGVMQRVKTRHPIYAFWRRAPGDALLIVVNVAAHTVDVTLPGGPYRDLLTAVPIKGGKTSLPAYAAAILKAEDL